MTDSVALTSTFSKAAPAYEPERWNNQVTPQQMANFRDSHKETLTKILAVTKRQSEPQAVSDLMGLQSNYRINDALIALNKSVETGMSDAQIATQFGLKEEAIANLRQPARDIYLRQGFQDYANCYSYAMNDPDRYQYMGDRPGERAEGKAGAVSNWEKRMQLERNKDYEGYKELLMKEVESDGAIIGGKDAPPMDGYYRVGVYAMPPDKMPKGDNGWTDMHFVRENSDGTWSHKPGSGAVTDKDKDGKPILDPKTANLGGYEFISYVYVPEGGLDVGPSWEPRSKATSVDVPLNPQENWKRRNAAPFPETQP